MVEFYTAIVALAEWAGMFLNGAPDWTVGLHRHRDTGSLRRQYPRVGAERRAGAASDIE